MMEGPVAIKLNRLSLDARGPSLDARGPRGLKAFSCAVAHSLVGEAQTLPRHGLEDESCLRAFSPGLPRNFEESVQQDLDAFWRWCPTPIDGLHRCGLLVKLFDYCGKTRKDMKTANQVRRLDKELRVLGVFETDAIQAHQRVPYEAFCRSPRLLDAVSKCEEARVAWKTQKRRQGRCTDGQTPLALWVLSIITMEEAD